MGLMEICIVTSNRLEYLKKCIWSIIASTSGEYQIHVVNDNSSDGTNEWLDDMVARELIYKVTHNNPNKGTANNFNALIKGTKGDWVTIANDDMWFHRGWDKVARGVADRCGDCGIVSFYDYQRIGVDEGVERNEGVAWRVLRTGLGASYINRESFNAAGKFQLPPGKIMGYFATPFCNKLRNSNVARKRVYHLATPMAIHMDFPQNKLNERDRYVKYNKKRSEQKNGK